MAAEKSMEAASGPHFSGLRIDSLRRPSSSSNPSSPSSALASSAAYFTPFADAAAAAAEPLKQPFVIGVSGGTASGKTTVCDMIIQQLHDHRVVLVNQDSFYRGLTAEESERVNDYNFDHPDAFDTEQLLICMGELKSGQSVNIPIYDFKNHRRCSESFRKTKDCILLLCLMQQYRKHLQGNLLSNATISAAENVETRSEIPGCLKERRYKNWRRKKLSCVLSLDTAQLQVV